MFFGLHFEHAHAIMHMCTGTATHKIHGCMTSANQVHVHMTFLTEQLHRCGPEVWTYFHQTPVDLSRHQTRFESQSFHMISLFAIFCCDSLRGIMSFMCKTCPYRFIHNLILFFCFLLKIFYRRILLFVLLGAVIAKYHHVMASGSLLCLSGCF
jgi:hypothetical protein